MLIVVMGLDFCIFSLPLRQSKDSLVLLLQTEGGINILEKAQWRSPRRLIWPAAYLPYAKNLLWIQASGVVEVQHR